MLRRCRERARQVASEIVLLSKTAFQQLLPHGSLFEEKLFGLTKSFIIAGKSEEIS